MSRFPGPTNLLSQCVSSFPILSSGILMNYCTVVTTGTKWRVRNCWHCLRYFFFNCQYCKYLLVQSEHQKSCFLPLFHSVYLVLLLLLPPALIPCLRKVSAFSSSSATLIRFSLSFPLTEKPLGQPAAPLHLVIAKESDETREFVCRILSCY